MIDGRPLKKSSLILREWLRAIDRHTAGLALAFGLCVLGILARLAPIAANRFHPDEAIYSYWALQIATGRDVWLTQIAVDKPPLYPYLLALSFSLFGPTETAARLPAELASGASLILAYILVKRLYNHPTALIALALMAFSPFNILFAPTALTDPLMVTWVLGALGAAAYGWRAASGLLCGLAIITKPQAVFFLPLVVGLSLLFDYRQRVRDEAGAQLIAPLPRAAGPSTPQPRAKSIPGTWGGLRPNPRHTVLRRWGKHWLGFFLLLALVVALAFVWDALRTYRPGFLAQSINSYGGWRWAPSSTWAERADGWRTLLRYMTGATWLDACLLLGLPLRLLYDLLVQRNSPRAWVDWGLVIFTGVFLCVHTVVEFNVWDRYMLALIPFLLILLARVLTLPAEALGQFWPHLARWKMVYGLGIAVLLFLTALRPAQDAANNRFSIGGDHGAYVGFDLLTNYFRGHVPGGAVVYHQALGWHYSFYLFDFPYLFQWYTSPDELVSDAVKRPGKPRYVAYPSWQSATQAQWLLARAGLVMRPIYETYRDDGSRSFILYRIEETKTHE